MSASPTRRWTLLRLARENPQRPVVFFAVGFETTAPANAMAVWQARREGLRNFSMLVSHVLVPPAIRLLLDSSANRVQGFIAPGHVCTVMGYEEYEELAARYKVPFVVGGFEPLDLLEAILLLVRQLEEGRAQVENQYVRSVNRTGNQAARQRMMEVFEWWTATGAESAPSPSPAIACARSMPRSMPRRFSAWRRSRRPSRPNASAPWYCKG